MSAEATHDYVHVGPGAPSRPSRHDKYFREDKAGNVMVLLRVDDVLFRVHRHLLTGDSSSFAALLGAAPSNNESPNDTSEDSEDDPVVIYGDTVEQWSDFLWIRYADSGQCTFRLWEIEEVFGGFGQSKCPVTITLTHKLANILHIADKYCFSKLRTFIIHKIQTYFQYDPASTLSPVELNNQFNKLWDDLYNSDQDILPVMRAFWSLLAVVHRCSELPLLQYLTLMVAYQDIAMGHFTDDDDALKLCFDIARDMAYPPLIGYIFTLLMTVDMSEWAVLELTTDETLSLLRGHYRCTQLAREAVKTFRRSLHTSTGNCRSGGACREATRGLLSKIDVDWFLEHGIWFVLNQLRIQRADLFESNPIPAWQPECRARFHETFKKLHETWTLEKVGRLFGPEAVEQTLYN